MVNYTNGKIYKIVCLTTNQIYIGSTTKPLSTRLANHRADYKLYKNGKIKSGIMIRFMRVPYLVVIGCACTRKNTHAGMLEQDEIFYLITVPIRLKRGTQVSRFKDM